MKFLVLLVGIFIVSACMTFFIFPALVEELIKWMGKKRNLHYVVLIRLVTGTILLLGAASTRFPGIIGLLGALYLAAAVLLLLYPADKIGELTKKWLDRPPLVVRLWVMLPLVLGIFVVYSVL